MLSPRAIVIASAARVLFALVAALAGPWLATVAIAGSLSIAGLTESDERRERRLREGPS